jgi:hypothetical protein
VIIIIITGTVFVFVLGLFLDLSFLNIMIHSCVFEKKKQEQDPSIGSK